MLRLLSSKAQGRNSFEKHLFLDLLVVNVQSWGISLTNAAWLFDDLENKLNNLG